MPTVEAIQIALDTRSLSLLTFIVLNIKLTCVSDGICSMKPNTLHIVSSHLHWDSPFGQLYIMRRVCMQSDKPAQLFHIQQLIRKDNNRAYWKLEYIVLKSTYAHDEKAILDYITLTVRLI